MSCKDSCVCHRRFKSRTVGRMVFNAGELTAGLNPAKLPTPWDIRVCPCHPGIKRVAEKTVGHDRQWG